MRAIALAAVLALSAAPPALAQDTPIAPVEDVAPVEEVGPVAGERAPTPEPEREPARMKLRLAGVDGNFVDVGERYRVIGKVFPWVPNQNVRVLLKRDGRVIKRRKLEIERVHGRDAGRFELTSKRSIEPGEYRFRANKHETLRQDGAMEGTRGIGVDYPDLDPGNHGKNVKLFNRLLSKQAFHTSRGKGYGSATSRAVLAYRKVNGMRRTGNATPGIFKTLADGRGGFRLKWPEGGKHVEVDLSRQVMVLAKRGKAKEIFHISSGAPATPTIRGKFVFTRRQYGTNSLGMVHSVYFGPTNRGYATHGYKSVPTYPASHGCIRNPIPNALFIYNWIDLGDPIYVYP